MSTITYTYENSDFEDVEVYVSYSMTPYWPGTREQPPEGGDAIIYSIEDVNGKSVSMTEAQRERLLEYIYENHEEDEPDYDDD